MLRLIYRTASGLALLFAAFLALGYFVGPSTAPATSTQEVCTRMWQDAMTTQEKYTARRMCDTMGVKP